MTFDSEALTENAEFLQRIAHQLIPDREAAADATQRVALAYLSKRPQELRSPRAWLVGALRMERRKWLERRPWRAATTEDIEDIGDRRPQPSDVAGRELREMVECETRAIREPYRSVLLASLFEEMSPEDVARKLGRSQATVRSQLMRGLELLRERLDRRAGGRDAWTTMLLPWSATRSPQVLEIHSASAGTGTHWSLTWLPALLTIGVCLLVWRTWMDASAAEEMAASERFLALRDAVPLADGGSARSEVALGELSDDPTAVASAASDSAGEAQVSGLVRTIPLRVVDENGLAIQGASILAFPGPSPSDPVSRRGGENPQPIEIGRTDVTGFALVEVPPQFVETNEEGREESALRAQADGFACICTHRVVWPEDPAADRGLPESRMTLFGDPVDVTLRVLDEFGQLCPQAETIVSTQNQWQCGPLPAGMVEEPIAWISFGEEGWTNLSSMPEGQYVIRAWTPTRGISVHSVAVRGHSTIDLPVQTPHVIQGTVFDPAGTAVPAANVRFQFKPTAKYVPQRWLSTTTADDGTYELVLGEMSALSLEAVHPGDTSLRATRAMNVGAGVTREVDLQLSERVSASIRLVDERELPLSGWGVRLFDNTNGAVYDVEGETDEHGRVRFPSTSERSLALAVYGSDAMTPPTRLLLDPFELETGERVLVVPNADAEPSAILGLVTTPGWTAAPSFKLNLGEEGVRLVSSLPITSDGEPFALEGMSPGTLDLAVTVGPALVHHLGRRVLPEGGFLDLGEVLVPRPGRVRFVVDARAARVLAATSVRIFQLNGTTGNWGVADYSRWPDEAVELLPGRYVVTTVDRAGTTHQQAFQVASGQTSEVIVTN